MKSNIRKIALVVAMLALMGGLYASRADATKPDPSHKVTLCHATHSSTNPYVSINVDVASVRFQGHDGHAGDIIPAFDIAGVKYAGKNLGDGGQAILDNGCKVPVTETTEPPTTDTTATTQTTILVCVSHCEPPPKPPTPPAPPAKPHKGHAKLTG